jgi:hypothetical protein
MVGHSGRRFDIARYTAIRGQARSVRTTMVEVIVLMITSCDLIAKDTSKRRSLKQ